MRVLILGGRAPVALDHARRFAAHGWTSYIADSASCRISAWSRAVHKSFLLPAPRQFPLDFARVLREIIEREQIDLVVPTCEEVFYLSRVRALLPEGCNVFVAPFDQLRLLHSKWHFLDVACDAGVPVPDSALVTELAEAAKWADGRPLVLKPEYSRFGVHVRIHRNGLPPGTAPLQPYGSWVAQTYQAGQELCSFSIAVKGRLVAHVTYNPKYRLKGSSSYYFESRAVPVIEAQVDSLVSRLGFSGQISFDWIERTDGTCVALECNPRAISGLHLFDLSAPLPAAIAGLYNSTVIVPGAAPPRMLAAVMLSAGLCRAVRSGTFREWQRDWHRAQDALFAGGDPAPFAGGLRDMLAFARLALRNRCSLRAATTRDIEWDGEPLSVP